MTTVLAGFLAALVMGLAEPARVNAESLNLEDILSEIDPTALTNFDLSALPELSGRDAAKLRALVHEGQSEFQGEYTLELAPIRAASSAVLPVLEQNANIKPVATWVRAGLATIVTADELRVVIPAPELQLPQPPPEVSVPPLSFKLPFWPKPPQPVDWPEGARIYVPQLKTIFVEEGVPAELVWLAEIESRFEPRARSRVGAVGLYQLMPDTAELLGLSVKPVDERLLPVKNARAAAQYLKYLRDKFGDWRLALAAYNGGEGRVWRLLEKSPARVYNSIASRLPPETQLYVTKVEATILRREGLVLAELSTPGTLTKKTGQAGD